jgi:hypothetical protein
MPQAASWSTRAYTEHLDGHSRDGALEHGRRPAPLNDHLSIFSNIFLNFYNIINIIILKLKITFNNIILYTFNFIMFKLL